MGASLTTFNTNNQHFQRKTFQGGGGRRGDSELTFLLLIRNSNGNVRKWRDYQWFWPGYNENWTGVKWSKNISKIHTSLQRWGLICIPGQLGRIWTDQQKVYFWCFASSLMAVTEIFTANKNKSETKLCFNQRNGTIRGTNEFRASSVRWSGLLQLYWTLIGWTNLCPIVRWGRVLSGAGPLD